MESGYMSHALKRYGEIIREEAIEELREKYLNEGKLIGLDQGVGIGKVEGREEGNEEKAISVAHWMLQKNIPVEDISEATGLSIEKIEELKDEEREGNKIN